MLALMSPATWQIGAWQFTLTADQNAPVAPYQRDLWLQAADGQLRHLRPFYFEDAQPAPIHAFCQRYAADSAYRAAVSDGTASFQQRDALFIRNAFNPYFQPNPALNHLGSLHRLFEFITQYTDQICALPDYQRIQQRDCAITPHPTQPDPQIAQSVRAWNALSGVRTLASCQGVSATVNYQGIDDIMTVSPHARYGYLWFAALPSRLMTEIITYTVDHPHLIFTADVYPALRSSGDNASFQREVLALARHLNAI